MSVVSGIDTIIPGGFSRAWASRKSEARRRPGGVGAQYRKTTVAVFGSGESCRSIVWDCLRQRPRGLEIAGVFADNSEATPPMYCLGVSVGGGLDELFALARSNEVDAVILAIPPQAERRIKAAVNALRNVAVDVYVQCDVATGARVSAGGGALSELPVRLVERRPLSRQASLIKSIEDRVLAAVILLLISPLMAAIALLVKIDSPGPIIFRQKRYGLNNSLIEIFKFRTLHVSQTDGDADTLVTRNDARVTRVGAFLRRTSLDELPQFFNVLRGEMSVVGPRPHALAAKAGVLQYDEIVANYGARHRVKPGITGWAQINGWRGETSTTEQIEQRVAHDFFYIANWSLLFDLRIVMRTVIGGFGGRQAY